MMCCWALGAPFFYLEVNLVFQELSRVIDQVSKDKGILKIVAIQQVSSVQ